MVAGDGHRGAEAAVSGHLVDQPLASTPHLTPVSGTDRRQFRIWIEHEHCEPTYPHQFTAHWLSGSPLGFECHAVTFAE